MPICEQQVEVVMHTTTYGWENRWRIENEDGTRVVCYGDDLLYDSSNYAKSNYKKFHTICKLCHPNKYKIICSDTYGDGWEAFGQADGAYLKINNQPYCEDFHSGYTKENDLEITMN